MRTRLFVAICAAMLAVICAWLYMRRFEELVSGGRLTQVVVASHEIAAGSRLADADVAVREIPERFAHPEAVLADGGDEAKIIGRVVAVHLGQGQPLLWTSFEGTKTRVGKGLAGMIQKGQRAITLPVDVGGSIGDQIRPGDRVDILGTFNRKDRETTITVLQNVPVLSIGGKKESIDGEPTMQVKDVTLSVALDEAELLVFALQHGTLNLVMRGDEDIDVVADIAQKSFAELFDDQKRITLTEKRVRRRPGIQPLMPDKGQAQP
jgi:pilus assembly protein CpaB